jgi:hypothetical protein
MLIPVHQAFSQIDQYLEQHPDDDEVPDQEELQSMVRLLLDYCWEDVALRAYGACLQGSQVRIEPPHHPTHR